jgi:gliding motility-associated protein GldL
MQSGNNLASSYDSITQGNQGYADQLTALNKNLQELNTAYEQQIKGTTEHMRGSDEVYKGLEHMLQQLKSSVEETEKYKDEMNKLTKNLADLNNIYGNMLTAMTVK